MREPAALLVAVAVASAVAVAVWLSGVEKCVRMYSASHLGSEILRVEVVVVSVLTLVTLNWGDWASIPLFMGPVLTKLIW
jgi:hypothetical protein